jgi:rRNA processing protein Gar1
MQIGKCTIKTQGKILVQLKGINLPKIGSKAFISKEGKSRQLGEVVEAIGSTQHPWIVISANKKAYEHIQVNDEIYTVEKIKRKKSKKFRDRQKRVREERYKRS